MDDTVESQDLYEDLQELYIETKVTCQQQARELEESEKSHATLKTQTSLYEYLIIFCVILGGVLAAVSWTEEQSKTIPGSHPSTAFSYSHDTFRRCASDLEESMLDTEDPNGLVVYLASMAQHASVASKNSSEAFTLASSLVAALKSASDPPWWGLLRWRSDGYSVLRAQKDCLRSLETILGGTVGSYLSVVTEVALDIDILIKNNIERAVRIDIDERNGWSASLKSDPSVFDALQRQISAWNATGKCHVKGLEQGLHGALWLRLLWDHVQELDQYLERERFLQDGYPTDLKTLTSQATAVLFQPQMAEQTLEELVRMASDRIGWKDMEGLKEEVRGARKARAINVLVLCLAWVMNAWQA